MDDLDVERFDKELRSFLDESLAHVECSRRSCAPRRRPAKGSRGPRWSGRPRPKCGRHCADILAKWLPFTAPRPAPVFDEARIAEARRAIGAGKG